MSALQIFFFFFWWEGCFVLYFFWFVFLFVCFVLFCSGFMLWGFFMFNFWAPWRNQMFSVYDGLRFGIYFCVCICLGSRFVHEFCQSFGYTVCSGLLLLCGFSVGCRHCFYIQDKNKYIWSFVELTHAKRMFIHKSKCYQAKHFSSSCWEFCACHLFLLAPCFVSPFV